VFGQEGLIKNGDFNGLQRAEARGVMGRKREHGTREWLTVREVADILGVSLQAIYNRIHNGTIDFEQHVEESSGEVRYRIPVGAVSPPKNLAESDERNAGRSLRVEETVKLGFDDILRNQGDIITLVREMKSTQREVVDTLKKQATAEEAYQQEVIGIMRDLSKRRSCWRRLFRR
jgi:excisionase family DNA binding protein